MSRLALICFLLIGGCTDRPRRNPLDPLATGPVDVVQILEAMAGNGQVRLRWDYTYFDDIVGYRLYRRVGAGEFTPYPATPLEPGAREFVDTQVENGTAYDYQLALLVGEEGEVFVEGTRRTTLGQGFRRAVPGEEMGWVADQTSGLVWKISPDGRSAHFARGRFPDLVGMALDRRQGACWVSDRFLEGLHRISATGEVAHFNADLGQAGPLSIAATERIGWIVDTESREVKWFSLEITTDTLAVFAVDASFVDPFALAAWEDHCWIVDRGEGRVLFYRRDGARPAEFHGLEQPGAIAAGRAGVAWVLAQEGRVLVRLDATRRAAVMTRLDLPLRGIALDVDQQSGACWVLGEEGLAALDAGGGRLLHWTGISGGQSLALDEVHRQVWIALGGTLAKFTMEGQELVRLTGFSRPFAVAVDPGI